MSSPICSAKSAGHKKIIVDFSATAQDAAAPFDKSGNADRNDGGTSCAAGLAAHNADLKPRGGPA